MLLSSTVTAAESNFFADEGTAAHELANHCLATGFDASRFAGWFVNIEGHTPAEIICAAVPEGCNPDKIFEIDEEMVQGVQIYLDTCREFVAAPDDPNVRPDWEVLFEERVYISDDPVVNGTCDFAAYNPTSKKLVVVDLKYGRHISVDPTENTQAILYALGVLKRYANRGIESIEIIIVQPRDGGPPVKRWNPDVLDLLDWEVDLVESARVGQALLDGKEILTEAHYKVGDWCKYCPALGKCEVKRRQMYEMAQAQFEIVDEGGPQTVVRFPSPEVLDGEVIRDMLEHLESFEAWKKAVIAYAHGQCEQGRQIPGWKLVQKRAYRKWIDEEKVLNLCDNFDIDPWQPRKIKSPAMLEPSVPGKNPKQRKDFLAHLVEARSSGTVLAREDDPRPAVTTAATQQFEEVSDGAS